MLLVLASGAVQYERLQGKLSTAKKNGMELNLPSGGTGIPGNE